MKAEEAMKLNLDIQKIYEKPLFEMSSEQQDEAVIKLIQKRFESYAEEVTKKAFDAGKFWGAGTSGKDFNDFLSSLRG